MSADVNVLAEMARLRSLQQLAAEHAARGQARATRDHAEAADEQSRETDALEQGWQAAIADGRDVETRQRWAHALDGQARRLARTQQALEQSRVEELRLRQAWAGAETRSEQATSLAHEAKRVQAERRDEQLQRTALDLRVTRSRRRP